MGERGSWNRWIVVLVFAILAGALRAILLPPGIGFTVLMGVVIGAASVALLYWPPERP